MQALFESRPISTLKINQHRVNFIIDPFRLPLPGFAKPVSAPRLPAERHLDPLPPLIVSFCHFTALMPSVRCLRAVDRPFGNATNPSTTYFGLVEGLWLLLIHILVLFECFAEGGPWSHFIVVPLPSFNRGALSGPPLRRCRDSPQYPKRLRVDLCAVFAPD